MRPHGSRESPRGESRAVAGTGPTFPGLPTATPESPTLLGMGANGSQAWGAGGKGRRGTPCVGLRAKRGDARPSLKP